MPIKIADLAYSKLGKLDLRRIEKLRAGKGVIFVRASTPALSVARRALRNNADLVVVVNPNQRIHGIVSLDLVSARVAQKEVLGQIATNLSFKDAIRILSRSALRSKRYFAHPRPFWCEKGQHYTSERPCPQHGDT